MLPEHKVRESLNRSIPHLPASAHDSIVTQFKKDGLVGDGDKLFASDSGNTLATIRAAKQQMYALRTPIEACEAAPMHINTVKWLRSELRRMNYDLEMEKPVDEFKLNQCMAGHDTSKRIAIKSAMAALKLIQP